MTNTFCDKTGEGLFALHMNQQELGLIADLLNSTNDPRAVRLRQAVNNKMRSDNSFDVSINPPQPEVCPVCNGNKKVVDELLFDNETKTEPCDTCKGEGIVLYFKTTRIEPHSPFWANELAQLPQRL